MPAPAIPRIHQQETASRRRCYLQEVVTRGGFLQQLLSNENGNSEFQNYRSRRTFAWARGSGNDRRLRPLWNAPVIADGDIAKRPSGGFLLSISIEDGGTPDRYRAALPLRSGCTGSRQSDPLVTQFFRGPYGLADIECRGLKRRASMIFSLPRREGPPENFASLPAGLTANIPYNLTSSLCTRSKVQPDV
jgi:hypothetical protein